MNSRASIPLREKARLMSASEIERTLVRLAHQIVEHANGVDNLGLVGIKRRGVPLAQRLATLIRGIEKKEVLVGTLESNLYAVAFPPRGRNRLAFRARTGSTTTKRTSC